MFLCEALKVVELLFTPRYCKAGIVGLILSMLYWYCPFKHMLATCLTIVAAKCLISNQIHNPPAAQGEQEGYITHSVSALYAPR